ncbi:methyl-accepting chemotaxis protein [Pelorhabdus rhamnosifermentans]|uniref:methyl-accepting chemotaxis protein n=1 Tax=Pelorhabdus rhamnosifermentans TaxID=2772457 RepID=UPI001C060A08|nr:methyl-accepting chemotaxis protein [Pelorhabdus rhamnosifermentans]
MNFFDNMKVAQKLSILILIAFLSMSIVGYTGYHYLQQSNTEMTTMYEDYLVPVALINENSAHINKVNSAVMELMLTKDDKKNQELKQTIDERVNSFNNNLAKLEQTHLDDKTKEKLAGIKTTMQKFREGRNAVMELALQNKNAEAYALYVSAVDPLATDALNRCDDLSKYSIEASKKINANNKVSFEKANQINLAIIFVSFVVLILSGFYITRIITKPLHAMVLICKEFAAGDFRDKPRRFIRKDEIGQLADALVDVRGSLRILMKNVNESAEQVAASSEELTASADQSAQAANQVAESITEVATNADQQLSAANDTSAVVEQMSASIQQIAANANEVAGQSAQASDTANEGNKSVDKAVSQMAHIEQTVVSSAQVVAKLGERSKEIGQIVDTISGIAGQTNLLALNAAIEAARAGEQGRGFAVVAEEVRKLAEQSQEAAKQIATLISEIQGDTDKAVIAMNDGTREVKLGAEVVNASGQAFLEIATAITHVSSQVKEISASIEQMAIGSQQIVGSVKKIDELSKKAAGEAQTVSAATEEQSASMEEIASSSQALAHLAMDLREAVSKFQV